VINARLVDPPLAGLGEEEMEALAQECVPLVDQMTAIVADRYRVQLRRSTRTAPGAPPVKRRGVLIESVTTRKARRRGKFRIEGEAGSPLPQAHALEHGFTDEQGRLHHPHPWQRPGEIAAEEPIDAMLKQEIEDAPQVA
jgi:hypothetical protein